MKRMSLTYYHCRLLRELRNGIGLPAEYISHDILGQGKSWLGRVERGDFKSIDKTVLNKLLKVLYELKDDPNLVQRFLDEAAHREAEALQESKEQPWFNQAKFTKLFSNIRPEEYSQLDFADEFSKVLTAFQKNMLHQFDASQSDLERFILLRMLRTLHLNALFVPELNIILNSTPLHGSYFNRIRSSELLESTLMFYDKYAKIMNTSFVRNPSDTKELLECMLKTIQDANNQLDTLSTTKPATADMLSAFNRTLDQINSMHMAQYLSQAELPLINQETSISRKQIGIYMGLLEDLNDKVAADLAEIEEYLLSQMIEESTAEYQEGHYQGMLPEEYESLSLSDDQTSEQNNDTDRDAE